MNEITYIIDQRASEVNHALCLQIVEAEKKGFTLEPLASKRPLTRAILAKLANEKDREALELLLKEEHLFLKKAGKIVNETGHSFHQVRINYNQSLQALKLLAATGKLYFNGKQLVADLFGKVDISFHLEQSDNDDILVSSKLKTMHDEFDSRQCDWMCPGQPHWFIRGISLKLISTDLPWKYLKRAYDPSPWILNKRDLPDFLESFTEITDGKAPKVIYSETIKHLLQRGPEPLPTLMLKDRSGAFADLWLDYGEEHRVAYHDPKTQIRQLKRNREAELHLEKDLLETNFIKKVVGTTHYYCPLDKVGKSLMFLLEVGWHIYDYKGNQVKSLTEIKLSLEDRQQTIVASGKIKYHEYEANVRDVIGAFNRRERFVELGSGTVGLLPDRWDHATMDSLVSEGEVISDGIAIKKHRFGSLAGMLETTNNNVSLDESLLHLKDRLQDVKDRPQVEPGPSFKGELRPYQQQGLSWLSFLYDFGFHGLLADDMGLGKTVQVIAFLSQLTLKAPVLIVMPTSLIFNWRCEIDKFWPNTPIYLHHGPQRTKDLATLQESKIILTTYATLRQDLPILSKLNYQCIILDEAQVIKNAHTQTSQAVCSLNGQFKLSITGTPIENHLGELWSHFNFLIPDLFGREDAFLADMQAASSDNRYLDKMRKKIRPFILRRTKGEVAKDLPECIDQSILVEMLPEQRQVYEDFLAGVKGNLLKKVQADGITKHRMDVLEAILRLRQICCHPVLLTSLVEEEHVLNSGKMDALMQDLTTVMQEGKKALIYSQFTSMLQVFAKNFQTRGWNYAYLDGSTTHREKVVQQFQEDPNTQLFLISLKAGGVGLNLTAADYVFLYDPWWNEAVENQAINRAHRIGRHDTVFAKRYVSIDSIEEKMMRLKQSKRSLVEGLFDSDMNQPNLTEEDFLYLLS